ncbi:LysM peptidoglycan-binding domain-containing protein [Alkanindiges sp. WGS2144]|uniref:LysM peptidoglycan-binding domain-containing protein n=1 Tax=Alkanindiges sp. WGS2144 TaxID=3366808 RepID=UPI00375013C8
MQYSVQTVEQMSGTKRRLLALTVALMAAGIVSGCSSTPQKKPQAKSTKTLQAKGQQSSALLDANSIDSLESLLSATDMAAVEGDRLAVLRYGDVWRRIRAGFKMNLNVQNSRINAQRSWFTTRQPYIDRLSARASRYLYHTVTEAERRGIPTELALLPVIESSYDPAATSSAAAAGMWQFIPSTGTIYGLRQNSIYDGRRDVVESTRAAYEFLTSLYNQFGSWELALAAYNAGPGRVQQAINRNAAAGLPTDYWSLKLPSETMSYVPRFLAVAQIIRNPEQYGIYLPAIANRPHFREVQLPGVVDLTLAASIAGLSYQELYELNPGFRSSYTDPMGPNRLLIPAALSAQVDQRLRTMPTLAQTNPGLMASLGPVGGAVILNGSNRSGNSFSTQQAAALMSAGTVNRNNTSSIITTPASSNANTTVTTTLSQGNKVLSTNTTAAAKPAAPTPAAPVVSTPVAPASSGLWAQNTKRQPTPTSASALAAFASQADLPSSPRIPVAVTPARNVQPIGEPPLSEAELRGLSVAKSPVAPKAEPQATAEEKAKIVAELQALAPAGTQVVDPLDGKIKLTAIQTSQSVAESKGQELKIKYEQPVLLAQKPAASEVKQKPSAVIVDTTKKPQGERSVHVVQSGDTLANIASRYGVSWRDVASWNQIDPNKSLYVGTSLYLYNAKKPQPARPTSYTVQAGDTLTGVAARFGLSNQQLAEMNNLSPTSNLLRGARLNLVDSGNSTTVASSASDSTTARNTRPASTSSDKQDKVETVSYKVKAGESVGSIANRYNISNEQLASLNTFAPNSSLLLGQTIKVPATGAANTESKAAAQPVVPLETASYTVKAGDTLGRIASRYNVSNEELAKLNKISPTSMVILGQKLTVPGTAASEEPEQPATYTVQAGDTLIGVAARFNLTPQQLAEMNDLKASSNLIRGATLNLLADNASPKTAGKRAEKEEAISVSSKADFSGDTESYTVKRGESLNSIAAKYDISVSDLAKLNQLPVKSMVQIGQKLSVPKLTVNYTIKRGDTLIKVASRHGVSVNELAKMNQISPSTNVKIGEVLVVPNNGSRSL